MQGDFRVFICKAGQDGDVSLQRAGVDVNVFTAGRHAVSLLSACCCLTSSCNVRRENREAIDKIVELLQEKETIDGAEFRAILSEYTTLPESVREQNKEPILA